MIPAAMSIEEIRERVNQLVEVERAQYRPNDIEPEFEADEELPGPEVMFSSDAVLKCLHDNQIGDAELFKSLNRNKLIFDFSAMRWMRFYDHYWQIDKTEQAVSNVQDVTSIYQTELKRQVWRSASSKESGGNDVQAENNEKALRTRITALQSKARINDVLTLARSGDDGLSTSGDDWDSKPLLLPCLNGVLNLDTGEFRNGKPSDMFISHVATIWKGENEPSPTWDKFIYDVMNGDIEKSKFLQRYLGYCISGLNVERKLPIFHGMHGQNGKGTMLETLFKVLGDFASEIPSETLLANNKDAGGATARPDLMLLRGKRMIWCSETDKGRQLSVAKAKWISGGDTIVCRQLYGQLTSFEATAKLIMLTNHRPKADGNDSALWHRLLLIPFDLTFVDNPKLPHERNRDIHLQEKLLNEKPGILAWLYHGFCEWRRIGLNPPESILAATRDYRQDNSSIDQFIIDACLVMPGVRVQPSALFAAYERFCTESGLEQDSKQAFYNEIKGRFQSERNFKGRWYLGIALKADREA